LPSLFNFSFFQPCYKLHLSTFNKEQWWQWCWWSSKLLLPSGWFWRHEHWIPFQELFRRCDDKPNWVAVIQSLSPTEYKHQQNSYSGKFKCIEQVQNIVISS